MENLQKQQEKNLEMKNRVKVPLYDFEGNDRCLF